MLLKIIAGALGAVSLLISSFMFLREDIDLFKKQQSIHSYIDEKNTELKDLEAESKTTMKELQSVGRDYLFSNLEAAKKMVATDGADLLSITALTDNNGNYEDIKQIADPEDVEFFTKDTDAVRYNFNITDNASFNQSMLKAGWFVINLDVDYSKKTAQITIPSESALEDGKWQRVKSIVTEMPTQVSTESEWPLAIPEDVGVFENMDDNKPKNDTDKESPQDDVESDDDQFIVEY